MHWIIGRSPIEQIKERTLFKKGIPEDFTAQEEGELLVVAHFSIVSSNVKSATMLFGEVGYGEDYLGDLHRHVAERARIKGSRYICEHAFVSKLRLVPFVEEGLF